MRMTDDELHEMFDEAYRGDNSEGNEVESLRITIVIPVRGQDMSAPRTASSTQRP